MQGLASGVGEFRIKACDLGKVCGIMEEFLRTSTGPGRPG